MQSRKKAKREINPFDLLSQEMTLRVFSFFKASTLAKAKQVCSDFNALGHDPSLKYYQRPLNDRCPWMNAASVNVLTRLSCGYLVSGHARGMIKIWDIEKRGCIQTLEGHQDWVRALVNLSNDRLASGSDDGTIKIWDLNEGRCVQTLEGHQDWVRALIGLSKDHLASGSDDKTIKIWDLKKGKCVQTLEGHQSGIGTLVNLSNDCLASGSYDGTIKIWNINSWDCIQTLKTFTSVYALTSLQNGQIACGTDNGIEIFSFECPEPLKKMNLR